MSKLNPQILDDSDDSTELALSIDAPIDEAATEAEEALVRPLFMQEDSAGHATAAERGTATHVFMQFADFASLKANGVGHEIERLIDQRFITNETARLIHKKQMERFADSGLMDKLLRSPMVKREFRFNVLLDGYRFTANGDLAASLRENGVKLTVQGVVDCVFRDPDSGRLLLIDYKTDSLTDEEWHDRALAEAKLKNRHRDQLTYYREICSEMFGEEIEGAYIYSTVLGTLIRV